MQGKEGVYESTLIIITAKRGQSPVDTPRYTGITATGPLTTSPSACRYLRACFGVQCRGDKLVPRKMTSRYCG
jgi:hypothetical protein